MKIAVAEIWPEADEPTDDNSLSNSKARERNPERLAFPMEKIVWSE
jgi:hypothetical protein